jgi:hypothetical protein
VDRRAWLAPPPRPRREHPLSRPYLLRRRLPGRLRVIVVLAGSAHFGYPLHAPLTFGVIAAGVVLGEMLPIKIPRRGNDEELTLSRRSRWPSC